MYKNLDTKNGYFYFSMKLKTDIYNFKCDLKKKKKYVTGIVISKYYGTYLFLK